MLGLALGLCASLLWALANVAIQRAGRAAGSVAPVLWGQVVGAIPLALALIWFPPTTNDIPWGWLAVGVASSCVAYVAMFKAFTGGPASVVSPIIAGWALVSAGAGVALFGEQITLWRGLGAALTILGVIGIGAGSRGSADWHAPRRDVFIAATASSVAFGVMVVAIQPLAAAMGPILPILLLWAGNWVVLLAMNARQIGRLRLPRGTRTAVVAFGLLEAGGFLAVDVGTQVAPILVVAPAASLASLLTVGIAKVHLGEEVGRDRALLAAITVVGIILLASGS